MEKQIEEQLKKLENELFSSFFRLIYSLYSCRKINKRRGNSALRTSEKGISTQH